MTDFPDFQEPQATATAIGSVSLTGTGLAKESGGNLDTHTKLLNGTQAGALIANTGLTVAQETAALIATGSATGAAGGAPLLHGAKQVFSLTGQVIPANSAFSTTAITLTKPGYLIRITALMSAAGAVTPYMEVDMNWSVTPNTGQITSEEIWYVNCGSGSAVNTRGKGPTKGNNLVITFTNGDLVDSVTAGVQVWETTQHVSRDDWRNPGGVPGAVATALKGDAMANILGNDNFTVAAGTHVFKNLPLYAGQANLWINQNAAAGSTVSVVPAGDFNVNSANVLQILDWTLPPHTVYGIALPRCPCELDIFNNGGAGAPFSCTLTALEFAS